MNVAVVAECAVAAFNLAGGFALYSFKRSTTQRDAERTHRSKQAESQRREINAKLDGLSERWDSIEPSWLRLISDLDQRLARVEAIVELEVLGRGNISRRGPSHPAGTMDDNPKPRNP